MATKALAGRRATIYVGGINASPFLNEFEFESERDDLEFTPFEADDKEFVEGSAENTCTLTGAWNGDVGSLDEQLDENFGQNLDSIITICPGGVASGKAAYLAPGRNLNLNISAPSDDIVELEAEFRTRRHRAKVLQGPTVLTATTTGTEQTAAALTTKGAVAHLHVLTVDGTTPSVTVEVEHSVDGTTWATLMTFDAATAPEAQRVETLPTATVNVKVRAKVTISGTTPVVSLVLVFARGK